MENDPKARQRLTKNLFSELARQQIVYAVKGTHEELKIWCEAQSRKDLDVWIPSSSWTPLLHILKDLAAIPVYSWTPPGQDSPNAAIFLFLDNNGEPIGSIDFSLGDLRAGHLTIARESLIRPYLKFVNDTSVFFSTAFLLDFYIRRVLRGKRFTSSHVARIQQEWKAMTKDDRNQFKAIVGNILSGKAELDVLGLFHQKNMDSHNISTFDIRLNAYFLLFKRDKQSAAKVLWNRIHRKQAPRDRSVHPAGAKPKPVLIAIVGTDGTGKSTLVSGLSQTLNYAKLPARAAYFGRVKGGIFGNNLVHSAAAKVFALRSGSKPDKQDEYDTSLPKWSKWLASWIYVFDYAVRHAYFTAYRLVSGKSMICDRYSYDLYIMPGASRLAAKTINLIAPSPTILCFLDIPQSTILARSDENAPKEIIRQQTILADHFTSRLSPGVSYIRITRPNATVKISNALTRLAILKALRKNIDNRQLMDEFSGSIHNELSND